MAKIPGGINQLGRPEASPALVLKNCSKAFDGTTVLRNASLRLEAGEVHALLGQNGSGKSTLIKILSGYHTPEPGAILEVGGRSLGLPVSWPELRELGVAFVHQDLGLAPTMSVMDNLRLGLYQSGVCGYIAWRTERTLVRRALAEFGMDYIDPDQLVSSLKEVERATVAILRAVAFGPDSKFDSGSRVLILDEATACLPRDGVERLFGTIRRAVARGTAVLFVTHRLDEVRQLADRVTVLRDGTVVECEDVGRITDSEIVERIVGRKLGGLYPGRETAQVGDSVMSVRSLSGPRVHDIGFDLHRNEILGLTGLQGMGHEQVPYLVFGAERALGGSVTIGGSSLAARGITPRWSIRNRVCLLPANRARDSGSLDATVTENVTLPTADRDVRFGWLFRRKARIRVRQLLARFDVRPNEPSARLGSFSGGNQQKALLAKWWVVQPIVLLLDEPTQGVDVGARQSIFQLIAQYRDGGGSVVYVGSEHEDLANLCDRVLVFVDGAICAELAGPQLTSENLGRACFGAGIRDGS